MNHLYLTRKLHNKFGNLHCWCLIITYNNVTQCQTVRVVIVRDTSATITCKHHSKFKCKIGLKVKLN